jgi:tetratricopeptide (TPR) repeat protein
MASELRPDDSYLWRFRAIAQFASGDLPAYRQTCAAILDRFRADQGGVQAANVLLACVLRDDALSDMGQLLPLCDLADPIWHWGSWVRASALYRAGRYEESVRCFEAASEIYPPRAWEWCFLAMAHQRLGHHSEAKRCLTAATMWIHEADREQMDDLTGTRPVWGEWYEPVVYRILLREAEALMGDGAATQPSQSEEVK